MDKEFATNRKPYREGKKPTAVKVYTISQESKYLLVENVPALGVTKELLQLFSLYGNVDEHRHLDDYPSSDQYNDVFWVKFQSLTSARLAKRKLDDHNFFSSPLRVRYCPEFETVEDTRQKLLDRRMIIAYKTKDGTEGQARPRKPPARDGSLVSHDANRATPSKIPKSNAAKVDHSYDYYDPSFYQYYVPSQDQPLPQPSFNLPVEHQEPPIHRLASLMAMSGVPTISLIQSPPPKASVAATPVAEIYSPQSPNTREANETNPVEQTALSIRQKITAVSKVPNPPKRKIAISASTQPSSSTLPEASSTTTLSTSAFKSPGTDTSTSSTTQKKRRRI